MSLFDDSGLAEQSYYSGADDLRVLDDAIAFQRQTDNHHNNAGRTGRSRHKLTTGGAGELRLTLPLTFQLTFLDEPLFTTGVTLAGGNLASGAFPLVSAGVWRWWRDGRGYYVGAFLWLSVGFAPTHVQNDLNLTQATAQARALQGLKLQHHLCFEGTAIRDVSYDAIMED